MADTEQVTVSVELKQGYQFLVDFGTADASSLLMDEPEPLGDGQGPNASRLLAAELPERQPAVLPAQGPRERARDAL